MSETVIPSPATPVIADGRAFLRLTAVEAAAAQANGGALLVDVRPAHVRRAAGEIPGSLVVSGPLREWRLGPQSPERIADLGAGVVVVVIGDGGSASVLVASALQGLGVTSATDVIGGFPAWVDAGLPVTGGATLSGRFVEHVVDHELVGAGH
jgi:rhodanese-related sulfurtransferase